MDRARQLQGTFDKLWEKKRKKRKRRPGAGVRHRKREPVNARTPCHVTVKLLDCFESLRRPGPMAVIEEVLRAARERPGRLEDGEFRIVQVSAEIEHLHLLVEAKDELSLSRGMQGFAIRLAKGLNKLWHHVGQVFKERFYSRALRSPREVRNVLRYLLNNGRRHQQHLDPTRPDPSSSGPAFDGWSNYCPESLGEQAVREKTKWLGPNGLVARARCWLLTTGWRRHGSIGLAEAPASGP